MSRLCRQRADEVRAVKVRGEPVQGEARQSATEIALDALLQHVEEWRRDLGE